MKVDLIGPVFPYRGGIAHYNASLAQALTLAGHEVHLISFRRQYPALLYPGKTDRDPSTEPLTFPADYWLDPLYPWTWLKTAQAVKREGASVLILHWWTTFWSPAYVTITRLVNKHIKVAYLIHNVLPHETRAWDRWLARITLRQGQSFIVQAPHERDRLKSLIPGATRIFETPFPAYAPFRSNKIAKVDARRRLSLSIDTPILLFFGIVRPYKGLNYLIDALAHVQRPCHLIIAGEFWEDVAIYLKQINLLGLIDNITVIDRYLPNEEAHLLFSAADVLVAPYTGGTQSAAAGLAMGYGLPMIVTEKIAAGLPGGIHSANDAGEYKNSDGYAKIVKAGDSLSLAQAIDDLLIKLPSLKKIDHSSADDWLRVIAVIEHIGQGES